MLFTVTAQEGPGIVIAYPGQDIELLCTVTPSGSQTAAWEINNVVYTVQQLDNGILTGYSSNGNNLIIENIIMNDDRNDTQYSCGTVLSTLSNPTVADIVDESNTTILYVAGEYQYNVLHYIVIFSSSTKHCLHAKTSFLTEGLYSTLLLRKLSCNLYIQHYVP